MGPGPYQFQVLAQVGGTQVLVIAQTNVQCHWQTGGSFPIFFFYGAVAGTIERERERDQWWVLMTPLRQLAPPHQLINLDRSFVFVGPFPFDGHIEWLGLAEEKDMESLVPRSKLLLSPPFNMFYYFLVGIAIEAIQLF